MPLSSTKLDKVFAIILSISNILTPTSLEFKLLGLETSIEFVVLVLWIFYDFLKNNSPYFKIYSYRYYLLLSLCFFLIIFSIEILIKNNQRAFYEINFLIIMYSFYQFQKIGDFQFLKKISILTTTILLVLLITDEGTFSQSSNWDYRWVGDEYVKRKSLYGYVSITLSFMITGAIIFLIEMYKLKQINTLSLIISLPFLFYSQVLTLSRSGTVFIILYILFSGLLKKIFLNINIFRISILISIILLIIFFQFQDFFSLYIGIYDGLLNNVRLLNAIKYLSIFTNSSLFEIFFGLNFFTIITDNTLIAIVIGKGIIGSLIYYFIFYFYYKDISNNKVTQQIRLIKLFTLIILFGFFVMDFFGQRKIVFLFALYAATLISFYGKKYNSS